MAAFNISLNNWESLQGLIWPKLIALNFSTSIQSSKDCFVLNSTSREISSLMIVQANNSISAKSESRTAFFPTWESCEH